MKWTPESGCLTQRLGSTVHRANPDRAPKAVAICGSVLRFLAPLDWRERVDSWDYRPCKKCWAEPELFPDEGPNSETE